jgi:hypothetical protein
VFVVTVSWCRPLQTFKATRHGIGKVDRMLPTASMAGMRWLLGAHCDERGLSWFHTARSGLYHPNAMPRAEHRHALNGVDIVGCDPGGLHPLVTHEGLTIASRLIGRVRPTTAPAPALVESATTMLACALGTSVDRCVAVPLDTVPRLTLVCSCAHVFACLIVVLSGNGASHADWIRGAATRLAVGMELFGFYASRHYRMLQLNAYSQRQRALAQMLRALAPNVTDVVVVGYGYRCVQASCQWQCQCVCAVWEYVTAMCVRVGCVSDQWSTPAAQGHACQLRAEVLGSLHLASSQDGVVQRVLHKVRVVVRL